MELDKENITRKSMAPQSKNSMFGHSKNVKSPIQEKLEGGKKKSRNTLVGAKTTSQAQGELTQKKQVHRLKVSIDLTTQTKSSMQLN